MNFHCHCVVSSLVILFTATAQLQLKLQLEGVLLGEIEGSFIRELSDTRRTASKENLCRCLNWTLDVLVNFHCYVVSSLLSPTVLLNIFHTTPTQLVWLC